MAVDNDQSRERLIKYLHEKIAEAPQIVEDQLKMGSEYLVNRNLVAIGSIEEFRPKMGGGYLPNLKAYSKLKEHVDEFLRLGNSLNRLISLPGLRGVGKTTLLFQLYKYLRDVKKIDNDSILYLSTDRLKGYLGNGILEAVDVFIRDVHKTTLPYLDKKIFLFIDEAHFDPEWSLAAKVIFDSTKNVFMIFTGSSALNMELNPDAARRIKRETVFPLDFGEYVSLKHGVYPPEDMAQAVRNLIFTGSEAAVENAIEKEDELSRKLRGIGRPVDQEWEKFLLYGGFPTSLRMPQAGVHENIFSMVDRVIEKDVFSVQAFRTDTRSVITRIIVFLALQKAGESSDSNLSKMLDKTSPATVRSILEILEKTHLIFSVKPRGGAGKVVRKSWKYYFLSPSIVAAIRFKLGENSHTNRELMGILTEHMAASYFFRMKETFGLPVGIFYDPEPKGADFLLLDARGDIIPLEIGIGKKDKIQIRNSINRYKSKHGIVVCDVQNVKKEGNVIFVPLTTFSFA